MEFVPLMFNRLCLTLIHKTKQNGLKRVILRVMEAQDIVLDSWPCRTPQKTLYESKWNPNHHVSDALKWRASATLYVRLVIIMLRTTITRHGQRLSALPLSNVPSARWVLVFKEGSFWFWSLNLSKRSRGPRQNLEANSSIFRTDSDCQWSQNQIQKNYKNFHIDS